MDQKLRQIYIDDLGCRFYAKQKAAVRESLVEEFEELGYSSQVQSKRNLILKAHNLIFGNLKSTRYVVMVPYDTPGRIFWPKLHYYPLDGTKSSAKATIPQYGPVIIFYFLFLGLLYVLPALALNAYAYLALSGVSVVIFIMIFILLFRGVPNKHNANRNTSGMLAAIELARSLTKEQRRQVAFVFTDRNDGRHFGSKLVADALKEANKNPMIILLNCIGKGEKLVLGATNGNKKTAAEIMKKYKGERKPSVSVLTSDMQVQSPMGYFTKGISIARGDIDNKGSLVVEHTCTKKDTEISEEGIDQIVSMLQNYFNTLK